MQFQKIWDKVRLTAKDTESVGFNKDLEWLIEAFSGY
jgi:hypothetical protein